MLKVCALSLILVSVAGQPYDAVSLMRRPRGVSASRPQSLDKSNGIPHFSELESDEKREIFHYEQTVAVRDSGKDDDKVRRCEVFEVYTKEKARKAFSELKKLFNVNVNEVSMDKIMDVLKDCDSVDDNFVPEPVTLPEDTYFIDPWEQPNKVHGENPLFNGIYPGTNWCGFGDIADNYHHLSGLRNVDRCCRSHDFCPIKVISKDKAYNLTNDAKYTKSHCRCDEAFYNCLKKDNGWSAKIIGKMYFSAAKPECIKGLPEKPEEGMMFVPAIKKW